MRQSEMNFIDDKAGKPTGIHSHIGRHPKAAFSNSDGELQMLQWTTAGERARCQPRAAYSCVEIFTGSWLYT